MHRPFISEFLYRSRRSPARVRHDPAAIMEPSVDVVTQSDWVRALADYARRLHGVAGDRHHVVSALGAWMVLALCGGLAETDPLARRELGEVLGGDPVDAGAFAGRLLSQPHPLVASGAGLWVRADRDNAKVRQWRAGLPEQVDTGDLPSQEKLDRWAFERSLGLIKRFPLTRAPDDVCLLASALATKVSWGVPFEVVDAGELGPSRWPGSLTRVLRTPHDPSHRQFLTDSDEVGPVAVHLAEARGGLLVGSVLAADSGAPSARVLAAAERIVTAEAQQPGQIGRLSLFELPLGAGPAWDIEEEPAGRATRFERAERFTTIMPAWSADTGLDLAGSAELGYGVAATAIARALALSEWSYRARQGAVAKYSAVGFEAAAITGFGVAAAARVARPEVARRAVIRFRHPYAAVAATYSDPRQPSPAVWNGLPVFSAWVAEVENAE